MLILVAALRPHANHGGSTGETFLAGRVLLHGVRASDAASSLAGAVLCLFALRCTAFAARMLGFIGEQAFPYPSSVVSRLAGFKCDKFSIGQARGNPLFR